MEIQAKHNVKIRTSSLCRKTIKSFSKDARLLQAFRDFIEWKCDNPLTPFRSRDKPFSAGPIKGIPHATLNNDVCVVYEISGTNPRTLLIHGLFSHDDLGTGTPPRQKLILKAARAFANPCNIEPYEVDLSRTVHYSNYHSQQAMC